MVEIRSCNKFSTSIGKWFSYFNLILHSMYNICVLNCFIRCGALHMYAYLRIMNICVHENVCFWLSNCWTLPKKTKTQFYYIESEQQQHQYSWVKVTAWNEQYYTAFDRIYSFVIKPSNLLYKICFVQFFFSSILKVNSSCVCLFLKNNMNN